MSASTVLGDRGGDERADHEGEQTPPHDRNVQTTNRPHKRGSRWRGYPPARR